MSLLAIFIECGLSLQGLLIAVCGLREWWVSLLLSANEFLISKPHSDYASILVLKQTGQKVFWLDLGMWAQMPKDMALYLHPEESAPATRKCKEV